MCESTNVPELDFAYMNNEHIERTGPSYQNESSDSVARKPLDEFQNTFNTK